jgi:hypothetical protein
VDEEVTMHCRSAGWLMAEFGIAFVAGVVGAMVTAHRRATPVAGKRSVAGAPGRVAAKELQPAL